MVAFTSHTSRSHFFLVHLTVHFKTIKLSNKEHLIQFEKMGEIKFNRMFNYSRKNLSRMPELLAHHSWDITIKTS